MSPDEIPGSLPYADRSSRRPIFLICAPHHDLEHIIRQRPLQRFASFHGARI
jgi:hypothetical protein